MEIQHDSENHKFYANVEGGEAHLLYRHGENDALDLYATEVPAQARGKNIADSLVREAIKQAKEDDVQIVDTCPYVKSWFAKHPEESAILAYPPEKPMHLI
jgi:Predicted acetyltransferase